jgi:demethylmenaquinone methyltransferase/2-methoxy-6-polyprenyl-1,4-benzoquinol methylase
MPRTRIASGVTPAITVKRGRRGDHEERDVRGAQGVGLEALACGGRGRTGCGAASGGQGPEGGSCGTFGRGLRPASSVTLALTRGVDAVRTDAPPVPLLPAYAERAGRYDRDTAVHEGWRRLLVDALPLQPGDTVLDVGCGTGLCFPLLADRIGPTGAIIGVDAAPAMLSVARAKVLSHAWPPVELVAAAAEDAAIPGVADAALFSAVHDVLQAPAALDNVFAHLRPGAWVAAAGGKWPAAWQVPLAMFVRSLHADYVRDFRGFDRPWRLLEPRLDQFSVREIAFGTGYLACGRVPAR